MDYINTGNYGEVAACKYLIDRGFSIKDKNYKKRWGELDIVAEKDSVVHFIEVKTVSYATKAILAEEYSYSIYRPEDRVNAEKKKKLQKLIEAWLLENGPVKEYQLDIMAVYIVPREKFATVEHFSNLKV